MNHKDFNPNAAADASAGIYGLPYNFDQSKIVLIPVPWEATTSYGGGTLHGPQAIINASIQLDLFDYDVENPYLAGIFIEPLDENIIALNEKTSLLAGPIKLAGGIDSDPDSTALRDALEKVNAASDILNQFVYEKTLNTLKKNKIAGIVGGDHSVPLGAFKAAAEVFGDFGILHFDAHSDTRNAFMGFTNSHASIMRNAATSVPRIKKFVQVGIRDFCEEEVQFTRDQGTRFRVFYDQEIQNHKLHGKPFSTMIEKMVGELPDNVWISFDIDGLDPKYCPHTGTPVPGGLDYSEATAILKSLAQSGRKIIGFDLVEVAPPLDSNGTPVVPNQASDEWDANVGMRLLYKLISYTLASQGLRSWRGIV